MIFSILIGIPLQPSQGRRPCGAEARHCEARGIAQVRKRQEGRSKPIGGQATKKDCFGLTGFVFL
jgi:hypothetical protein